MPRAATLAADTSAFRPRMQTKDRIRADAQRPLSRAIGARQPSMPQLAHRADIAAIDLIGVGHSGNGPLDACFAQQMQHGIRRAIGEVLDVRRLRFPRTGTADESSRSAAPPPVPARRCTASHTHRNSLYSMKSARTQRMDQQRRLALRGSAAARRCNSSRSSSSRSAADRRSAHPKAHTSRFVGVFRKGTQAQTDDRSLQPVAGRRNDRNRSSAVVRHSSLERPSPPRFYCDIR